MSYVRVAEQLAVSRPAIRSLLGRARQRIRLRLRDIHTALGGAPWVEALARLALNGSSPAAPARAALGLGAAAIAGGALMTSTPLEHHVRRPAAVAVPHAPHVGVWRHVTRDAPTRRVAVLRNEVVTSRVPSQPSSDRTERTRASGDAARGDGARAAVATVAAGTDSGADSGGDGVQSERPGGPIASSREGDGRDGGDTHEAESGGRRVSVPTDPIVATSVLAGGETGGDGGGGDGEHGGGDDAGSGR
jgi:hypothetical protein